MKPTLSCFAVVVILLVVRIGAWAQVNNTPLQKAGFLLGGWQTPFQGGTLNETWSVQSDSVYTADEIFVHDKTAMAVAHLLMRQRHGELELDISDGNYSKTIHLFQVPVAESNLAFESARERTDDKMKIALKLERPILHIFYSDSSANGWQDHSLDMTKNDSSTSSVAPQAGQWVFPIRIDTTTRDGYTLYFLHNDSSVFRMGQDVEHQMIQAFFASYPKEAAEFNPQSPKEVFMMMDPNCDGVAYTQEPVMHIGPKWMLSHPADIDVVTHEEMHIVQGYGYESGPAWLVEGIADYARFKFGVANDKSDWKLADYQPGMNYTDGYRVSARFLVWLEKKVKPGITQQLNKLLRERNYSGNSWKDTTGKNCRRTLAGIYQEPWIIATCRDDSRPVAAPTILPGPGTSGVEGTTGSSGSVSGTTSGSTSGRFGSSGFFSG